MHCTNHTIQLVPIASCVSINGGYGLHRRSAHNAQTHMNDKEKERHALVGVKAHSTPNTIDGRQKEWNKNISSHLNAQPQSCAACHFSLLWKQSNNDSRPRTAHTITCFIFYARYYYFADKHSIVSIVCRHIHTHTHHALKATRTARSSRSHNALFAAERYDALVPFSPCTSPYSRVSRTSDERTSSHRRVCRELNHSFNVRPEQ